MIWVYRGLVDGAFNLICACLNLDRCDVTYLFCAAHADRGASCGRGGQRGRLAAATCIFAVYATRLTIGPLQDRFRQLEAGVADVDFALLAILIFLAVRAKRYWPIWAVSLHLVTLFGRAILTCREDRAP